MNHLEFDAESVTIETSTGGKIAITASKPDLSEILKAIGIKEVIAFFDSGDILDQIGKGEAKEYWDLVEPEEE